MSQDGWLQDLKKGDNNDSPVNRKESLSGKTLDLKSSSRLLKSTGSSETRKKREVLRKFELLYQRLKHKVSSPFKVRIYLILLNDIIELKERTTCHRIVVKTLLST